MLASPDSTRATASLASRRYWMLPVARILSSVRPRRWSRTTVWSWATPSWRCFEGRLFEEGGDGFGFGGEEVVAVAGDGDEGVAGGLVEFGR